MKSMRWVFLGGVLCIILVSIWARISRKEGASQEVTPIKSQDVSQVSDKKDWSNVSLDPAVEKGLKWLVSVQGKDGGWGQDGGEGVYVRKGENLESQDNDVANTCVATLALVRAGFLTQEGEYQNAIHNGLNFVLGHIEKAPNDNSLAITDKSGTQIQRKLGPYIDTFLSSMLLAEADGNISDKNLQARVSTALKKCIAKIEKNQQKDGSWNVGGGWASVLGTSFASRGLSMAAGKVTVTADYAALTDSMTRAESYAEGQFSAEEDEFKKADGASAGVPLYQVAAAAEQMSRTDANKQTHAQAQALKAATAKFESSDFVKGFGSMGGEEFFSYLNIGDSLRRAGGEEWTKWNGKMKESIISLQNQDGTWSGHHCITGRVACTGAAVLTILAERAPDIIAQK